MIVFQDQILPIDFAPCPCYKLEHDFDLHAQASKAEFCHPFEGVWHRFVLGVQHQPLVKTKPPFKMGGFYY